MEKSNRSVVLIILAIIIGLGIAVWMFCGKYIDQWFTSKHNMKLVQSLGIGINIGNDLDVYGVDPSEAPTLDEYERAWGNVPVTQEVFSCIKKAGFKTVRIPVTYSDHMDDEGIIDNEFMGRVKDVVDMALDEGLYVIIDTHHEKFIVPT